MESKIKGYITTWSMLLLYNSLVEIESQSLFNSVNNYCKSKLCDRRSNLHNITLCNHGNGIQKIILAITLKYILLKEIR